MSGKLKESMDGADSTISKFASGFVKKFALAGAGVAAFIGTATAGLAKFATSLVEADDELTDFQEQFGMTRDEAYQTKSALDVMGKSMEEVQLDPDLLEQFNELKENAADLKVPDMSKGLDTVRSITTSVMELKQTATNALMWVGHSFLKYVQKPMEDIQHLLKGFNETIKKNIPDWGDKIGKALSWIVQLGGTIIRAGAQMLGAVKKVFDAIPDGVKIAIAALGALAAFIKMGPVGKLITIISLALLLLDDFFTYLDGGDSLLAPVWKTLTDFFSGFEKSGKDALAFFSEDFLPKLVDYVSEIFPKLVDKVLSYVDPFVDWIVEVLDGIINAIAAAIPELLKLAGNIALSILEGLLSKAPKIIEGVTGIVKSAISAVKKMIPRFLEVAGDIISRLIDIIVQALPDILDAAVELVMAVVDGIVDALPDILNAVVELLDKLLTALIDALPRIVESGVEIVDKLVEGLLKALPKIVDSVIVLIKSLVAELTKQLPKLIQAGFKIIESLINGIVQMLPEIIEAAIELIEQLLNAISDMLPEIIDMGIEILLSLIDGILNMLPKLIDAAITLMSKILQAIFDNLPKIIEAGIDILLSLINGIVESIPQLIQAVIDLIPVVVQALIDNLPKIIEAGIEIIIALVGGIIQAIPQLVQAIPQIIKAVVEGLGSLVTNVFDIGKNVVQSLWNGISNMGNWIKDKVGGFFKGIFDGVGDFFGNLFGKNDKGEGEEPKEGHAEGGVFTKEHVAEFAEDDKPEAVIPLTKPKRAADVLKQAADFMTGNVPETAASGGANTSTAESESSGNGGSDTLGTIIQALTSAINGLSSSVEKIYEKGSKVAGNGNSGEIGARILTFLDNAEMVMGQMSQITQSTVAYNAVSNSNVSYNTTSIDNRQNYTINDTSGSPRTTAAMVGRTQELHSRNLKGVFV